MTVWIHVELIESENGKAMVEIVGTEKVVTIYESHIIDSQFRPPNTYEIEISRKLAEELNVL